MSAINTIKTSPGISHLLRRRYERYFAAGVNTNLFRGVFQTHEEAQASAPLTKGVGYDNPEPAKMYREYMEHLTLQDYTCLFWLEKIVAGPMMLLDLGGHVGVKYYAYRRYLANHGMLNWRVFDVPAVTKEGQRLADEMGAKNLSFTSDYDSIQDADILFASGSLQYLNPSLAAMMSSSAKPAYILVNNLPVYDGPTVYTLQNIGTAFCPYKIFNGAEFVKQLEARRYELLDTWKVPGKGCHIPYHPRESIESYTGYVFAVKNN